MLKNRKRQEWTNSNQWKQATELIIIANYYFIIRIKNKSFVYSKHFSLCDSLIMIIITINTFIKTYKYMIYYILYCSHSLIS